MYFRQSNAVNLHHYAYYLWLSRERINSIHHMCLENIYKNRQFQISLTRFTKIYITHRFGRIILLAFIVCMNIYIEYAFVVYFSYINILYLKVLMVMCVSLYITKVNSRFSRKKSTIKCIVNYE